MSVLAEIQKIISGEGEARATPESIRLPAEFVEPYDTHMWEGLGSFFGRPWWR